jgi:thiol-disulfide isomerase/thioredoxin
MTIFARIRFVSAIALGLLSTGYATAQEEQAGPTYQLLKPGDAAPPLNFRNVKGSSAPAWESLRGQVVVLDFWATWCQPCIKAIPDLNALVDHFKSRPVRFFSVAYESEKLVNGFLEKHPMQSEIVIDNGCSMFRSYRAWGIPMVAIAGGDGKIKAVVHPTELTAQLIDEVLAGKTPQVKQAGTYKDPKGAEDYFCRAQ